MNKILLFFMFVLIFGCNKSGQNQSEFKLKKKDDNPNNTAYVSDLRERAIKNGDSRAFGELIDYYGRYPSDYHELLSIAIIMADKFNDDKAKETIYFEMIMIKNNGKYDDKLFFNLTQAQQDFVVSYLIDGAKNENSGCKAILRKILEGGYQIKDKKANIEQLIKE